MTKWMLRIVIPTMLLAAHLWAVDIDNNKFAENFGVRFTAETTRLPLGVGQTINGRVVNPEILAGRGLKGVAKGDEVKVNLKEGDKLQLQLVRTGQIIPLGKYITDFPDADVIRKLDTAKFAQATGALLNGGARVSFAVGQTRTAMVVNAAALASLGLKGAKTGEALQVTWHGKNKFSFLHVPSDRKLEGIVLLDDSAILD
jgi:hypothetical protein